MVDIRDMNTVRDEMNNILTLIETAEFTALLRQSLSEFEYQGLNVTGIAREIYRRGLVGNRTPESVRKDVSTMIILFLSRGNNVDKMITRTNDAGKIRITTLKNTYNIANRVGNGGNTIITLSRVAAVFPLVTLGMLANPQLAVPRAVTLSADDFGLVFPRQMQTVISAAIFPKSILGSSLMKALLLYLIEENKLLSNEHFNNDQEILAKVIPFARASFVSSVIVNRVESCQSLGLLTTEEPIQIPASIAVAVNTFTRKFPQTDLNFIF
ncbi:capsid [Guadeloupe mosquito phasivirus]|uniref:Nucleoprotein n=1 Tax=Guadeloupe mosquito phasivirus TaxID=2607734 RepID=A0A5C1K3I7_9VIRU|nr:capsid [Guadeloupe mosquito phasivirus]QEM39251.1 capsid [Guadeloupe mosquito phasivirus]